MEHVGGVGRMPHGDTIRLLLIFTLRLRGVRRMPPCEKAALLI